MCIVEYTGSLNVASVTSLPPVTISTEDAAILMGLSVPVVRELTHRKDFPAFKVGKRTLISYDGLRQWAQEQPNLQ